MKATATKTRTAGDKTRLQGRLAVASFVVGSAIAVVGLFVVPPPGEISNSAISIVSEFLVLAGALLGIKVSFDYRLSRFETQVERRLDRDHRGPGPYGYGPAGRGGFDYDDDEAPPVEDFDGGADDYEQENEDGGEAVENG